MAYSAAPQITPGEFVDENDWNRLVDNITFLANPPSCRAYRAAVQSIPHATSTAVQFTHERWDTASIHDPGTPTRLVAPVAGLYAISFTGELEAATDYLHAVASLSVSGSVVGVSTNTGSVTNTSIGAWLNASTQWKFAAGDYLEVNVFFVKTAAAARNLNASGSWTPEVTMTWIGLG